MCTSVNTEGCVREMNMAKEGYLEEEELLQGLGETEDVGEGLRCWH